MPTAIGSYATAAALKELIGTTDSDDDNLVATLCDRVNQYIETVTHQPVCPIAEETYTYDGDGLRRVFLPMPQDGATEGIGGAREVTLLEVATQSNGTYAEIAETDYVLRGRHGVIGPYRWLLLSDKPVGTTYCFPEGIATVRVTMTAGWDAIPDDLTETALIIAQRAWNARAAGQQDVSGTDEHGLPFIARYSSSRDKQTIHAYRARPLP